MLGEKLRELRKDRNYKTKDVATCVGVHITTYLRFERNQSKPKIFVLAKLADLYGVRLDYLLEFDEDSEGYSGLIDLYYKHTYVPSLIEVPIEAPKVTTTHTHKRYRHDVPEASLEVIDQIVCPKWWELQGDRYIGIEISDNSMFPVLLKGDNVIISTQTRLKSGDLVLIQEGEDYAVVRKCVQKRDQTYFIAHNPAYKYKKLLLIEDVEVIGVVVEARRTLYRINKKEKHRTKIKKR